MRRSCCLLHAANFGIGILKATISKMNELRKTAQNIISKVGGDSKHNSNHGSIHGKNLELPAVKKMTTMVKAITIKTIDPRHTQLPPRKFR